MSQHIDYEAAYRRKAEIAMLMDRVRAEKTKLKGLIQNNAFTAREIQEAIELNASTNPDLAEIWSSFIAMGHADKLQALNEDRLKGMHWQSLLQCNPYCITNAWRGAHEKAW